MARDVPGFVAQLLVYPVTDCTLSHPSIEENGEGYFLDRATMQWFVDLYLGDAARDHPRASPTNRRRDTVRAMTPLEDAQSFVIGARK